MVFFGRVIVSLNSIFISAFVLFNCFYLFIEFCIQVPNYLLISISPMFMIPRASLRSLFPLSSFSLISLICLFGSSLNHLSFDEVYDCTFYFRFLEFM